MRAVFYFFCRQSFDLLIGTKTHACKGRAGGLSTIYYLLCGQEGPLPVFDLSKEPLHLHPV